MNFVSSVFKKYIQLGGDSKNSQQSNVEVGGSINDKHTNNITSIPRSNANQNDNSKPIKSPEVTSPSNHSGTVFLQETVPILNFSTNVSSIASIPDEKSKEKGINESPTCQHGSSESNRSPEKTSAPKRGFASSQQSSTSTSSNSNNVEYVPDISCGQTSSDGKTIHFSVRECEKKALNNSEELQSKIVEIHNDDGKLHKLNLSENIKTSDKPVNLNMILRNEKDPTETIYELDISSNLSPTESIKYKIKNKKDLVAEMHKKTLNSNDDNIDKEHSNTKDNRRDKLQDHEEYIFKDHSFITEKENLQPKVYTNSFIIEECNKTEKSNKENILKDHSGKAEKDNLDNRVDNQQESKEIKTSMHQNIHKDRSIEDKNNLHISVEKPQLNIKESTKAVSSNVAENEEHKDLNSEKNSKVEQSDQENICRGYSNKANNKELPILSDDQYITIEEREEIKLTNEIKNGHVNIIKKHEHIINANESDLNIEGDIEQTDQNSSKDSLNQSETDKVQLGIKVDISDDRAIKILKSENILKEHSSLPEKDIDKGNSNIEQGSKIKKLKDESTSTDYYTKINKDDLHIKTKNKERNNETKKEDLYITKCGKMEKPKGEHINKDHSNKVDKKELHAKLEAQNLNAEENKEIEIATNETIFNDYHDNSVKDSTIISKEPEISNEENIKAEQNRPESLSCETKTDELQVKVNKQDDNNNCNMAHRSKDCNNKRGNELHPNVDNSGFNSMNSKEIKPKEYHNIHSNIDDTTKDGHYFKVDISNINIEENRKIEESEVDFKTADKENLQIRVKEQNLHNPESIKIEKLKKNDCSNQDETKNPQSQVNKQGTYIEESNGTEKTKDENNASNKTEKEDLQIKDYNSDFNCSKPNENKLLKTENISNIKEITEQKDKPQNKTIEQNLHEEEEENEHQQMCVNKQDINIKEMCKRKTLEHEDILRDYVNTGELKEMNVHKLDLDGEEKNIRTTDSEIIEIGRHNLNLSLLPPYTCMSLKPEFSNFEKEEYLFPGNQIENEKHLINRNEPNSGISANQIPLTNKSNLILINPDSASENPNNQDKRQDSNTEKKADKIASEIEISPIINTDLMKNNENLSVCIDQHSEEEIRNQGCVQKYTVYSKEINPGVEYFSNETIITKQGISSVMNKQNNPFKTDSFSQAICQTEDILRAEDKSNLMTSHTTKNNENITANDILNSNGDGCERNSSPTIIYDMELKRTDIEPKCKLDLDLEEKEFKFEYEDRDLLEDDEMIPSEDIVPFPANRTNFNESSIIIRHYEDQEASNSEISSSSGFFASKCDSTNEENLVYSPENRIEIREKENEVNDDSCCSYDHNLEVSTIEKYRKLAKRYKEIIQKQAKELDILREECETSNKLFTSTEMAFSDLYVNYQKSRAAIEIYKENEDILLFNIESTDDEIEKLDAKYEAMNCCIQEKINETEKAVTKEKQMRDADIAKLQSTLKRMQIKVLSLENSLQQKTDECQALSTFWDDMTGNCK